MLDIVPFDPIHYDDARELWMGTPGVGLRA